jgi:hypothetical protein
MKEKRAHRTFPLLSCTCARCARRRYPVGYATPDLGRPPALEALLADKAALAALLQYHVLTAAVSSNDRAVHAVLSHPK